MRLKLLLITIALFVGFGTSYGQILTFDFAGLAGTEVTATSNTKNANLTTSTISRGAGLTAPANGDRFNAADWATTSIANAVTGNDYMEFTITPTSGFQFSVSSIVIQWQRSGTGSTAIALRSSLDGYAANLDAEKAVTDNTTTQTFTFTFAQANSTTAVTYRLYSYAEAVTGTGGPGDGTGNDITVNGTVTASGITSTQNGPWSSTSTWVGGIVPTSSQNAIIAHNVTTGAITRDSGTITIINTGASLAVSGTYTNNGTTTVNGSFQLDSDGWATGSNFTYGATGTLNFNSSGSYGVSNTDVFWPATSSPFNVNVLQGGVTLNSANRTIAGTFAIASGVTLSSSTLILSGTAQINGGGFFNQSPIYGNASTLKYNTGVTPYGRGLEWSALGVGTIGTTVGYPNNVQLSGNTTLNYNNGTPLAKAINGNLTIDLGSSFYMDYGGGASGGILTVAGNLINNGNFTLGNTSGDDLKIGGNITFNTGYTFDAKGRAIFFTKNGTQIITASSTPTFNKILFIPTSGTTTVQLAPSTSLNITTPLVGGDSIDFGAAANVFDINGNTLTLGTAGRTNTITGTNGTFKGSITSNLTLYGTGSLGTLTFASNLNLGTLTMDRQAATVGCTMGSTVTINTALTLTNGLISLGNFDMSLGLTATNTGSINGFVISDPNVGIGKLTKRVDFFGAYTLHIGENTAPNGAQYAPATINFSSGTFSPSAYYGLQVKDAIHPKY